MMTLLSKSKISNFYYFVWQYNLVCVGHGQKPRLFSHMKAQMNEHKSLFVHRLNANFLMMLHKKLEFIFYVKTDVSPLSTCMSKICKQEL